jgi:hypothetical protein
MTLDFMGSVPSMNKKFAIMQKKRALLFYKNLSGYGIILYILYSSFNVFATRLFFIKRKVSYLPKDIKFV